MSGDVWIFHRNKSPQPLHPGTIAKPDAQLGAIASSIFSATWDVEELYLKWSQWATLLCEISQAIAPPREAVYAVEVALQRCLPAACAYAVKMREVRSPPYPKINVMEAICPLCGKRNDLDPHSGETAQASCWWCQTPLRGRNLELAVKGEGPVGEIP